MKMSRANAHILSSPRPESKSTAIVVTDDDAIKGYAWSNKGFGNILPNIGPVGWRPVAFNSLGNVIIVQNAFTLRAYNWSNTTGFGSLINFLGDASFLAISPDDKFVFIAPAPGSPFPLAVYNFSNITGFGSEFDHNTTGIDPNGGAWNSTGTHIFAAGAGADLAFSWLWSNTSGFGSRSSSSPSSTSIGSLALNPVDGSVAVVGDSAHRLHVWPWNTSTNFGTQYPIASFLAYANPIFSPNGQEIILKTTSGVGTSIVSRYAWSTASGIGAFKGAINLMLNGDRFAFDKNGLNIVISGGAATNFPKYRVYPWYGNAGFGTAYSYPPDIAVGSTNPFGALFSPN